MVATTFQDDLVILPKELARNLSNISRLVLAKRIGSGIHVIDPLTGEVRNCCVYLYCCRRATMSKVFCALSAANISVHSLTFFVRRSQHSEISTDKFWRHPFKAIMTCKQFTRYIVLNVEPVLTAVRPSAKMGKARGSKAGSVSRGRGASLCGSWLCLLTCKSHIIRW
jgi:NMD protein affecting ribosome stability and mRNA decay